MRAHIYKHHREASEDLDHLDTGKVSTAINADNEEKDNAQHKSTLE